MAFDREDAPIAAEKLLRQGQLDAAIVEYGRVVEDRPDDWNTANILGDLYVRSGRTAQAVAQYARVADHLMREGAYPKAAAFYKKILKIDDSDERAQLQLAEIAGRQGLLADARAYLNAVAARRRARGDARGVSEIVVLLGALDPADFEARMSAARALESLGEAAAAAEWYRTLQADLAKSGRTADATAAVEQILRLNPDDRAARAALAREALQQGDSDRARQLLDRTSAGNDAALLLLLLDVELQRCDVDAIRELLPDVVRAAGCESILERSRTFAREHPDAAFACVEAVVDASVSQSDFPAAEGLLEEFLENLSGHAAATLKLGDVSRQRELAVQPAAEQARPAAPPEGAAASNPAPAVQAADRAATGEPQPTGAADGSSAPAPSTAAASDEIDLTKMLGEMDAGDAAADEDTIEWLQRAADTAPIPGERHALLYELGVALEGSGERARALAVLLDLQREAGDYRDVSGRVDRLARVQSGG